MIIFLIIILFLLCLFELIRTKKVYSPMFIFNLIWLVTLCLYQLQLSIMQQNMLPRTMMAFVVSIFSFNIVFFIYEIIKYYKKKTISFEKIGNKVSSIVDKFFGSDIDKKIAIGRLIVLIVFIIEIIYSDGVPLVWKLRHVNKTYFDFGITSLTGAWYGLMICLGAYSFFTKSKDKYLYLLIGVLILSRQLLISLVLEGVICFIINKSINIKKKIITILIVMIVGFLGFNFLGNIRSGSDEMDMVFNPKPVYKELPSSIKWTYSYMTFSVSNFNNLVSMTDGGENKGVSSLKEVLPNVIANRINFKEKFTRNFLIIINYNVSTAFATIYIDFGLVGVGVFSLILGIIGLLLYTFNEQESSARSGLLYAVYLHNIVFLFFINMFFYLPIIIQFLYIIIIFSEKKKVTVMEKIKNA